MQRLFFKVLVFSTAFLFYEKSYAQDLSQFSITYRKIIPKDLPGLAGPFGGISAMELMGRDSILLVSDLGLSYTMNLHDTTISENKVFNGTEKIESFRYNPLLKRYFYCYENEKSGVGYLENGAHVLLFEQDNGSFNRGFEGVCFTLDNALWISEESGTDDKCDEKYSVIYKIPYDSIQKKYNVSQKIPYYYPFNKCQCTSEGTVVKFNGTSGNGISEIIASTTDTNTLFVVERCYDKPHGYVTIYKASIFKGSDTIRKQPVINLNDLLQIKYPDVHTEPGNVEAMTWGLDKNGKLALYLFTDNNVDHPTDLQNILYILSKE